MTSDDRWMRAALTLGARGLGRVWPNPAVGCVIVKDGRMVGRGWTQPGGRPHAEPQALAMAGDAARGATAYVTLEPCAHHGKTPPCAEALIAAGVARVVIGTTDPDPRVAGGGVALLQAAGIEVSGLVLEPLARAANAGFFSRIEQGRPLVTLKLASSLDGRIATGSGDSRWITGPTARRRVHALRATHDAVMVGIGTARADDPDLRVRDFGDAINQPVRVVADTLARLSPDGRLATSARDTPVWLLHGASAPMDRRKTLAQVGMKLIEVPQSSAGLDMGRAMRALGDHGLTRVLSEGGGQLAASLVSAGLVDRLLHFGAGVVIGAEGQPNFGPLGLGQLSEAPRFRLVDLSQLGGDTLSEWVPVTP